MLSAEIWGARARRVGAVGLILHPSTVIPAPGAEHPSALPGRKGQW